MTSRTGIGTTFAFVALGICGCGISETKSAAEKKAAELYQKLAAGNLDEVVAVYSPKFFANVTRDEWRGTLAGIQEKLGPYRNRALLSWNMRTQAGTAGSGTYTILVYRVSYANANTTETLTFLGGDSKTPAELVGHNLNLPPSIMSVRKTERPEPAGGTAPSGASAEEMPYPERRRNFQTQLKMRGPSPQPWSQEAPSEGMTVVEYMSDGRPLRAWLYLPETEGDAKHPALVYCHGGFAFGSADFDACRPFADAGYVVLCPTFRGENGNSGYFEMMFGEVDDAAAAVRWLAQHPRVDAENIYTFGHSSGGAISALLSLYDDLPIRHGGSVGGLYGTDLFTAVRQLVPFDANDEREKQMRVLVGNIRWMKRPHFAFVGTEDRFMKVASARAEASESGAPLTVIEVAGDHHSSLAPAMEQYLGITSRNE